MKCVFIVLVSISVCSVTGTYEQSLVDCLKSISQRYFGGNRILLFNLRQDQTGGKTLAPSQRYESEIKFFTQDLSWTIQISTGLKISTDDKEIYDMDNIVIVINSNSRSIRDMINNKYYNQFWNSNLKVVIIAFDITIEVCRTIVRALWIYKKSVYVLVMLAVRDDFEFYTWFPYRYNNCYNVSLIYLDQWSGNGFLHNTNLFPRKLSGDFNNCPLIASTTTMLGFVEKSSAGYNLGLEGKLVHTILKHYNLTLNYRLATSFNDRIPILQNGSINGVFAWLYRHEIDFAYFGLRLSEERMSLAEPVLSYYQDSTIWVLPNSGLLPKWKILFYVFSFKLWLALILTFGYVMLILLILKNILGTNFGLFTLESFGIFINLPVFKIYKVFRPICIFLSLFGVHLSSAYQSSLFVLLTNPPFDVGFVTPLDALRAGLKCYLIPSSKYYFEDNLDVYLYKKILEPDNHILITKMYNFVDDIAYNKDGYFMSISSTSSSLNKYLDETGLPLLKTVHSEDMIFSTTFYFARGHPLWYLFNKKVTHLLESGLVQLWVSEYFDGPGFLGQENSHIKLSVDHLSGVFYVLCYGLVLSLFVYFVELSVHCLVKSGNKKFVGEQESKKRVIRSRRNTSYYVYIDRYLR